MYRAIIFLAVPYWGVYVPSRSDYARSSLVHRSIGQPYAMALSHVHSSKMIMLTRPDSHQALTRKMGLVPRLQISAENKSVMLRGKAVNFHLLDFTKPLILLTCPVVPFPPISSCKYLLSPTNIAQNSSSAYAELHQDPRV